VSGCRERRIRDAREQLRPAHKMFSGFGMEAFAERARGELRATGAQALKRTAGTPDVLTAQETLIARLASPGASKPADRRTAVHQPRHRRLPPKQGLRQARHQLAQPARPHAPHTAGHGADGPAKLRGRLAESCNRTT
jgi:hypothetical protein